MSTMAHRISDTHTVALHHPLSQHQLLTRRGHREAGPRVNKAHTHQHHRGMPQHILVVNAIESAATEEVGETDEDETVRSIQSTMVGSGRHDPFLTRNIDSDMPPIMVSQLLDQAGRELRLLLPRGVEPNAFPDTIMRLATSNKSLIYSLLAATLAHTRARAGIAPRSALENLCATRSIQALKSQVSSSRRPASVDHIWTAIGLALLGKYEGVRSGPLPRQSPVREWQSLRIHGSFVIHPGFYRGFGKLVSMMGGLEAIKEPGVGACLSYATLCSSTISLQRHPQPFVGHTSHYLGPKERLIMSDVERSHQGHTSERLGTYFGEIWTADSGRPMTDLLRVVTHMVDFIAILESYLEGRPTGRSSATLMDQNNFTHHALISLPSAREFTKATGSLSDELYEPCRLACVIFSLLVTFPMPLTMPLCSRVIAALLHHLMVIDHVSEGIEARQKLLAWILSMGAIFAIGLPERAAFLRLLVSTLDKLKIRDLRSFKMLLSGFLWHPRTNDFDGVGVWRDVQKLQTRTANEHDNTVQIAERTCLPDREPKSASSTC